MPTPRQSDRLVLFPTDLGWMGLIGAGKALKRLTFGHPSEKAAMDALAHLAHLAHQGMETWNEPVVRRLKAYATGKVVDFSDVPVDLAHVTDFQRCVLNQCRKIPYGQTQTYGQLAASAGSPQAARAAGNCMAANPIPLIVPCHRVVPAAGGVGAYSSAGGQAMKKRLLAMESQK